MLGEAHDRAMTKKTNMSRGAQQRQGAFSMIPSRRNRYSAKQRLSFRTKQWTSVSELVPIHQWRDSRSNSVFVLALGDIGKELPSFRMPSLLTSPKDDRRSQSLQFQKIAIGEDFQIAAEIRVRRILDHWRTLDKECVAHKICAPARGAEDAAHLFFKPAIWVG